MNQKLNTWLCKHFDKEETYDDGYGSKVTKTRKGYVTLWDIFYKGILSPIFIYTICIGMIVCLIAIPGIIFSDMLNNSEEFYSVMIYGIEFWIVIAIIGLILYTLMWISSYKVAICPLVEKMSDDSKIRTDLKEAEEKMFKDIINDGDN